MSRGVPTISLFTLCAALLGCAAGTEGQPDAGPDGSTSGQPDAGPDGGPGPQSAKMPLPTRGIPDPVLHEVETPEPLSSNLGFGPKGLASELPGPAGGLGRFGDRVEQCVQQGGTLADCAGTAGLCAARDAALGQVGGVVFD
ncbi:MAG: hypothetical protein WCE62_05185, partial [Polyangiales bacterium]